MAEQQWPDLGTLPGVADAVAEARSAIEGVHRHPANRRGWPRSAAAASIRAARASAALDGGKVALDREAQAVLDPVLAGALRVAAELGSLIPVWSRAPLQVLARLHTLAAADLVDGTALGMPRSANSVPDRLSALARAVVAAPWPGPVLVAVVHGELLSLNPFGSADGVVARAAARIAMISCGLDPHGLTVPEVGHFRTADQYRAAAVGYRAPGGNGIAPWIVHVCVALVAGAREGRSLADSAAPAAPGSIPDSAAPPAPPIPDSAQPPDSGRPVRCP